MDSEQLSFPIIGTSNDSRLENVVHERGTHENCGESEAKWVVATCLVLEMRCSRR